MLVRNDNPNGEILATLGEGLDQFEAERTGSIERLKARAAGLNRERKKLLRAYYADAIIIEQLKSEQDRITAKLSQIERQLQIMDSHVEAARRLMCAALRLAGQLPRPTPQRARTAAKG